MRKVLLSLPVLVILISLLTVNCFAASYTAAYDVSSTSSQGAQLAGYVFNRFPFSYASDYVCFSTSTNDYYLFVGKLDTTASTYLSGSGRVFHMSRQTGQQHWSFSWIPDDNFVMYFGAVTCGNVPGTTQLNYWHDYYRENVMYTFFTLFILISGISMFISIKRSL